MTPGPAAVPGGCAILLAHGDRLEDFERSGQAGYLARIVGEYAAAFGEVSLYAYGARDGDLAGRVAPARVRHPSREGRLALLLRQIGWGLSARSGLRDVSLIEARLVSGMLPALLARWRWGRPVALRCGFDWSEHWLRGAPMRGVRGFLQRRIAALVERVGFRNADLVIASTGSIERTLVERHPFLRGRTVVQPHPIDLARIPAKERYGLGDPPALLFVGRLAAQKDLPTLLDAVARLERPVRLDLVGEGPLRGDLEAVARARRLDVRFLGTMAVEDLCARYRDYDLFVFPTLYEGFPKALAEALAAGLPVATTDAPGNRDLVEEGRTGRIVRPGSPPDLAAAIRGLLDDPALRERLGRAARAAAARYDWRHVMDERMARLRALAAAGPVR